MAKRDADFSERTKTLIASRAGYRCSFPDCDQTTVGPGVGPDDVEKKGVAAHIFSASEGGPRGTGGLTVEQRQSATNGFWCCEDHGRIIDNDAGKNYPASQLLAWRDLHEQRIANELRKVAIRSGWLQEVEIRQSPLFRPASIVRFGKVTLVLGSNGAGKTAICEWVSAALGHPDLLRRWDDVAEKQPIRLGLGLLSPSPLECELVFDGQRLGCTANQQQVSDLTHILRVRYPAERMGHDHDTDPMKMLAGFWRVHEYEVPELLDAMCWDRYGFVRELEVRDVIPTPDDEHEEGEIQGRNRRLYARIGGHQSVLPFGLLSGREQSQVIVSGAMALADRDSKNHHVVLIIDLGDHFLPDELLSTYARRFADPKFTFQTIIISPNERPRVDWSGWSVVRLEGRAPDVVIHQEVIERPANERSIE